MNHELPDVQAGFTKGRGTRDQVANIHWIVKKAREFQKKSTSALLTTPKPLTVWITINCGKLWKRWEYQTTWPASWEICMQVKKQQLEQVMEQQTGSILGKEYVKAVCCHPAYLTYMQSMSCCAGWTASWYHVCREKCPLPYVCTWHYAYGRKQRGTKEPLENEKGERKSWLKTQLSKKQRSWHTVSSLLANRWGNNGNSYRPDFHGLQNHCRWRLQPWN